MVVTPWGDSGELRDRKLPPGRRTPPLDAARNQRERLYAAMVASCEERGYEESAVGDLLELSGISSRTFYQHFEDKQDCFRAATEEILDGALSSIVQQTGNGGADERARNALDAFMRMIVREPAASRMVFVESYAAGEPAVEPVRQTIDQFGRMTHDALEELPGHENMPNELSRAIIGGLYRVIHSRLQAHREAELPELAPALWRWATNYRPPPRPLRLSTRRRGAPEPPSMPPFATYNAEQRILRAFSAVVAEKGYGPTSIADIAAAASISQGTFYEYFVDKADALTAAIDSSGGQMLGVTLPAARRAPDWPHAVRLALGAACDWM